MSIEASGTEPGFTHAPLGGTSRNTIHSASRLLLPALPPRSQD